MAVKSYIFMVIGIVLAKSVGFLRDIIFASRFGTSSEADIYFTVFSTVTLIFTGIGVALSTVIIKHLNKQEYTSSGAQRSYVSFFIKRVMLVLLVLTALMYVFADKITYLLIPGISEENFTTALKITYIMIPSTAFVTIAYILYGVLQNNRVFFITSIMSLPYNIMVIASLFLPDISIISVSIVTTLGWLTHILILLPDFYRQDYRFFAESENHKMPAGEIFCIFISNMLLQLCLMIDKSSASTEGGMASCVNYSSNLFVTAASVFIVAMSSVTFPALTKSFEEGDIKSVNKTFSGILSVMWAIFLPFLAVCILFGENIVSLLYQRGEFTSQSTEATAILFVIYSFTILGYIAEQIFNKILFLDGKYKFTVCGTVITAVLKLISNMVLVPVYGAYSAAVCTAVLLTLYGIAALIKISPIIGGFVTKPLLKSLLKTALAVLAAFAVYLIFAFTAPSLVSSKILFLIPLAVCAAVYFAAMIILKAITIFPTKRRL